MLSRWGGDKWISEQRCPTAQTGAAGPRPYVDFHWNQSPCKIQNLDFKRQKDSRRMATVTNVGFLLNGLVILSLDKLPSSSIPCDSNAQDFFGDEERNSAAQQ